jgi:hypothetical protein
VSDCVVKILVFTEGTIIMHRGGVGHSREEVVRQVEEGEKTIHDWISYVPVGDAVTKLETWKNQGAEILYLTSRTAADEVASIKSILRKYKFPGRLLSCREGEQYNDVAERVIPDIFVEDDCESIGGAGEMTISHVDPEIRKRIKSISVKEFGGIDHLPDDIAALKKERA